VLRKPYSILCEPINVGCFGDGMSVTAQVTVSQVVGKDEHDVGAVCCSGRTYEGTESEQETEKCLVHVQVFAGEWLVSA
jgi:hypothetical protein